MRNFPNDITLSNHDIKYAKKCLCKLGKFVFPMRGQAWNLLRKATHKSRQNVKIYSLYIKYLTSNYKRIFPVSRNPWHS